jgi:hypothetical protein
MTGRFGSMRVISFKNTRLFKRGMWLSAVALTVFAGVPSALNGALWANPWTALIPLCVMSGFWVYFFRKTQIHRLADEVVDCRSHLAVTRGKIVRNIPFSEITAADVTTVTGIHRITIRLRSSKLDEPVEFLPQASLWGNIHAIRQVAMDLMDRASREKSGTFE